MELIHLKTAAKLVQESPDNLRRLIALKEIEVYPATHLHSQNVKIIKSSLLAYYQQKLLQEIGQQMPQTSHYVPSYQHLQQRIHRLQNFGRKTKQFLQNQTRKTRKDRKEFSLSFYLIWALFLFFGYLLWKSVLVLNMI
jgi:hypothetical protein